MPQGISITLRNTLRPGNAALRTRAMTMPSTSPALTVIPVKYAVRPIAAMKSGWGKTSR